MCNLDAPLSLRRDAYALLAGCATVKVIGQRALGAVPTAPPSVIYVSDFTFSAEGVSAERGILPISLVNEAASESSIVFSRIFGVQINRGVRERELANLMVTSLIEDLRNLGVTAYRFGLTAAIAYYAQLARSPLSPSRVQVA